VFYSQACSVDEDRNFIMRGLNTAKPDVKNTFSSLFNRKLKKEIYLTHEGVVTLLRKSDDIRRTINDPLLKI
jgi:DNA-binding transcriptional regulator GbsR (MarR family)